MDAKNEEVIRFNRSYKDSVFRMLFSDEESVISLYNAIFDTNYGSDTPVDFATIREVLFKTIKNDIAFTIADQFIVLVEHQSTISENMALRDLLYFAAILQKMFKNRDFYREKALRIPNPSFIVLYNGTAEMPDFYTLNLSDNYKTKEANPALQLTVKVYNINNGRNTKLLGKCRLLYEYSRFVSIIRENMDKGPLDHKTVRRILEQCRKEGILTDFLKEYGEEAVNMLFLEMTEEEARELSREDGYEAGLEEGKAKGKIEGERQKALDIVRTLKAEDLDLELIIKATGLSKEDIEKI